jgi:DNA polymerase III subunit epsilon
MECSCGGLTKSKTHVEAGEAVSKYEECQGCHRVDVTWKKRVETAHQRAKNVSGSHRRVLLLQTASNCAGRPDFAALQNDPSAFLVIDVETANSGRSSICQVGVVVVSDNQAIWTIDALINPEQAFTDLNVSIHGIDASAVSGCMSFPEFFREHSELFEADIPIFSHSRFDEQALYKACDRYDIELASKRWGDIVEIAKHHWGHLDGGHGLKNLSKHLGISFNHHNALSDATAAAEILLTVMRESGKSINDCLTPARSVRARKPTPPKRISQITPLPNALNGEVVLFTGKLSLTRDEYKELAKQAGASIAAGVTQSVTMVVIGVQDRSRTCGRNGMSKTEQLIEDALMSGRSINRLDEVAFTGLLEGKVGSGHE